MIRIYAPGLTLALWAMLITLGLDPLASLVPFLIAEALTWFGYLDETKKRHG